MSLTHRISRTLPFGVIPATLVIFFLFGGGLLLGLLQALGWQPGEGLANISFSHFKSVLQSPDFSRSLFLTFYISTVSTFFAALISLFLAIWLTGSKSKNTVTHFVLQIPLTVPHLVAAVSMLFLLAPTGLISRFLIQLNLLSPDSFPNLVYDDFFISIILVYIWKEIPFITMMLIAVLKNSGQELHEVGKTLNCNAIQRFFYITLPLAAPNLFAASLIVFAYTFGSFEVPFLLGKTYPVPLPVWSFKNYTDIDLYLRPQGIAIALIITLVIILLLIPAYRYSTHSKQQE